MRALIALVIAGSLAPSVTAADCGWVLWKQTTKSTIALDSKNVTTEPIYWQPVNGFDQLVTCQDAARGAFAGLAKGFTDLKGDVTTYPGEASGFVVLAPEKGHQTMLAVDFVCFPGVFDPRPRGCSGE